MTNEEYLMTSLNGLKAQKQANDIEYRMCCASYETMNVFLVKQIRNMEEQLGIHH